MHAQSFLKAALWAVVAVVSQTAYGQYGQPPGPQGYSYPAGYGQAGDPMTPMPEVDASTMGEGMQSDMGGGMYDMGQCGPGACYQGWTHRYNVFGEFLYLRARNAEIAYAFRADDPDAGDPAVPIGRVGVVDPDFSSGFRVGAGVTLDETSSLQLSYTEFDESTPNTLIASGTDVIRPLVLQPLSPNALENFTDAAATQTLQFKLVDVDYRGLIAYSDIYKVNYLIGARYAKLDQDFEAGFNLGDIESVASTVNFDGGGLRFGLEAERYGNNNQLFVYGKTYASLIGGEFRANYLQSNPGDEDVAFTTFRAGRLVSIYDMEVGAGWANYCGNFRVSAGYTFSIWCNTLKNNEFINAVQTSNVVDLSDSCRGMLSFDGFVVRTEFLW